MNQPIRRNNRRTAILVILALVVVGGGVGTWYALSRPAGVERADIARLDKQRAIVDKSMNIYDPLVQEFTARYTNVVSEGSDEPEKERVLNEEGDVLTRESRANTERLEAMASSPALQHSDVADAFGTFRENYGAVIAYNDQLVINTVNITRSVGGPCAPLHTALNVSGETYPEEYVKTADACLGALASGKDRTDAETTQLLTDLEAVIKGQRDKQQEAVAAQSDLERLALKTKAAVALLDINDALGKARTTYESAVKAKQTQLVENANASNAALESALKKSLESFDAAAAGGK